MFRAIAAHLLTASSLIALLALPLVAQVPGKKTDPAVAFPLPTQGFDYPLPLSVHYSVRARPVSDSDLTRAETEVSVEGYKRSLTAYVPSSAKTLVVMFQKYPETPLGKTFSVRLVRKGGRVPIAAGQFSSNSLGEKGFPVSLALGNAAAQPTTFNLVIQEANSNRGLAITVEVGQKPSE